MNNCITGLSESLGGARSHIAGSLTICPQVEMDFCNSMDSSHAPFKDQIDDETVMFDLENSMDTLPETPRSKNFDNDSDTQKTQTNMSSNTAATTNTPRKEGRVKPETILSRVSSFAGVTEAVNLEDIYEYDWADSDTESSNDKGSKDSYMVQEVLADFLKIKSFKRKYPDLTRRTMDAYERSWLQQEGIVPLGRADLGLTALKTEDVMRLLQQDYPDVHVALTDLFRRRRFQAAAEQQKRQYEAARIERGEARAEAARRRALDSAADFNHRLVTERLTNRRCYWDLQTMQIHLPKRDYKLLDSLAYPNGAYPVAVIPGQFADYYNHYTAEQLYHLPLNSVLYPEPNRKHKHPPSVPTTLRYGSLKPKIPIGFTNPFDTALDNSQSIDHGRMTIDGNLSSNPNSESHPIVEQKSSNLSTGDDGNRLGANNLTDGSQESHLVSSSPKSHTPDPNSDKRYSGLGQRKSTLNRPKTELDSDSDNVDCSVCGRSADIYLRCSECKVTAHPKCLDISDAMLPSVQSYGWSCMECKRCVECNDSGHEEEMMFCDRCDRGYHAFCVGLKQIPAGKWECPLCVSSRRTPEVKKRRYTKSAKPKNSETTKKSGKKSKPKPENISDQTSDTPKRKRGRPRKNPLVVPPTNTNSPTLPVPSESCIMSPSSLHPTSPEASSNHSETVKPDLDSTPLDVSGPDQSEQLDDSNSRPGSEEIHAHNPIADPEPESTSLPTPVDPDLAKQTLAEPVIQVSNQSTEPADS